MAAAALVMLLSCETQKPQFRYSGDQKAIKVDVRIKSGFVTKTNPHSENAALDFNKGDQVFITSEAGSIVYEYDNSGWNPTDNYYFRWGSEGFAFHASYPNVSGSNHLNFTVPTNQSTIEKMAFADYMTCNLDEAHNDGSGVLTFEMERRMTKVIYTLEDIEPGSPVKGFKIGSYSGYHQGQAVEGTTSLTPLIEAPEGGERGGDGTRYIALVVPGDASPNETQISMVYKNNPLLFTGIPEREAGMVYEYTVKLEGDDILISSPIVSPWEEGSITGGEANPNKRFHYFVKPDGTGTGKSWEDAMGVETLRALLSRKDNNLDDAQTYDLTKFHFCAGNYLIADDVEKMLKIEYTNYPTLVRISMDGGYNPASTGTSLTDRNPALHETVFSGNNDRRIFQLGNQVSLSLDGIKFTEASSGGNGGALFLAAGNTGNCSAVVNDCKFVSNTAKSGPAVAVLKGSLECTSCEFTTNSASGSGGAVFFGNDNSDGGFTDCTFTGNESIGDGGAISLEGGALVASGCNFSNNTSGNSVHTYTDTSTGKGGAVYAHASSCPSASFINCVFNQNQAGVTENTDSKEYGGAIAMKTANISVSGCEFSSNRGGRGAALMMLDGGGLFKANSCTFFSNNCYSRGVFYVRNNNVAYFNNCSVYDQQLRGTKSTFGIVFHGGENTAACFNNCSISTNPRSYTNSVEILNTDGSFLLLNTTVIGPVPQAAVRTGKGASVFSSSNSVIINTSDEKNALALSASARHDAYNVLSSPVGASASDSDAVITDWSAFVWNPSSLVFVWDGVLSGYTRATQSQAISVMDNFNVDASSWGKALTDISDVGANFKAWLESFSPAAYSVDALGTVRNADSYWPGSYQL